MAVCHNTARPIQVSKVGSTCKFCNSMLLARANREGVRCFQRVVHQFYLRQNEVNLESRCVQKHFCRRALIFVSCGAGSGGERITMPYQGRASATWERASRKVLLRREFQCIFVIL